MMAGRHGTAAARSTALGSDSTTDFPTVTYDILHRTEYHYAHPVSVSYHLLHLAPRRTPTQVCHRSALMIDPVPAASQQDTDFFGNAVAYANIQDPHSILAVEARSSVAVKQRPPPAGSGTETWERVVERVHTERHAHALDALQYAFVSPFVDAGAALDDLDRYVRRSFRPGRPVVEAALELTRRIYTDYTYDPTATTVSTPVEEAVGIRRGVCQDFAHVQIAALRLLGLPARYVSGYLLTHPPPGREKLRGADASHAWLSLWCGALGWVDLDPTNGVIPRGEHITVAWGRDYGDVSPISGAIFGGGAHTLKVSVDVAPVEDLPARRSSDQPSAPTT